MQGRGGAAVFRVHVGAFVEQKSHGGERAEAGGVVQWRGTRAVFGVDESGVGFQKFLDVSGGAGANGGDEGRDFRVDGRRRGFLFDLGAEVGALIDPGFQERDFLFRQRACWGHLQAAIAIHDAANQLALGALAGDDDGTIIAAAHRVLPLVETQAGLLHVLAVAGVAALCQEGLDLLLEVHPGIGRSVGGRGESGHRNTQKHKHRHAHHTLREPGR